MSQLAASASRSSSCSWPACCKSAPPRRHPGAGFGSASWLPTQGWAFTGGDYSIAVLGDRFLIGERKKIGSLDELRQLLQGGQPPA